LELRKLIESNKNWFIFQIEEEIEEITEYISDKENPEKSENIVKSVTTSGPWLSTSGLHSSVDCILAELDSEKFTENSEKIPFPEFGVDIVLHHKNGKLKKKYK